MRTQILCALIASFLIALPAVAQVAPPPVFPGQAPPPPPPGPFPPTSELLPPPPGSMPAGPVFVDSMPRSFGSNPFRVWMDVELLLWWVKNTPMPTPLVSGVDVNNNPVTLFGNSNTDLGTFSGLRFGLGAWFDTNYTLGMETNIWYLERQSNQYFVSSDQNGTPPLSVPFFNQTPGNTGEFVLPLSTPGVASGNVVIGSSLSLWGAELNGTLCLARTASWEFTALGGLRYMDLRENLSISNQTNDLASGTVTTFDDSFNTRNQFFGGQVGTRLRWYGERLTVDLAGKVALGGTYQSVDIQGTTTQFDPTGFLGASPGGFFAQPSNMGRYSATQFAVIPSLELKLGYQITPRSRLYVGYDFIYWNQVVRPGNQVDRNINVTQTSLGAGTLSGPAYPTGLFSRSDFWAQGVNFGFEFRF